MIKSCNANFAWQDEIAIEKILTNIMLVEICLIAISSCHDAIAKAF